MTTTTEPAPGGLIREYDLWLPGWVRWLPSWVRVGAVVFVLCAVSLYVRTKYVGGQYWMDEAITVGISSHSLSAIPGVLRYDGSPPLFYLLLHIWMSMVGDKEAATHWLSEIIAVITVPAGYWAGNSLSGNRRTALVSATFFAFNAFIDYYSVETRMYALMTLLGLLATVGFVQGFVFRNRRYVALFAIAQALMLYTHNWSLFFGAASVLSLIVLWFISGEEIRANLIKDAVFAFVGAGILFLPWVPNFIYQTTHTAAPWDTAPGFGAPVQIAKTVFGGASITAVMLLATGVGYAALVRRENWMSREAKVVLMFVTLAVFTLLTAWLSSHILTPAWDVRYFAPIVPAMVLFLAFGTARAGIIGAIAVVFVVVYMIRPSPFEPQYKSDMQDIAGEVGGMLHKGDLVIVGQPEQTPLAYYYMPAGLKWANTIGPVSQPSYMNWVNALPRYQNSDPFKVLPPMLNELAVGQQVLLIQPLTEGEINWAAPWTILVRRRSAQYGAIIAGDKQFVEEAWAPHDYTGSCCIADQAVLYKKVS